MTPTIPSFLAALPSGLRRIFSGRNLLWHVAAWAITAATVLIGVDWWYFVHTQVIPAGAYMPAVILGGLLPIVVPLALLITGYARRSLAVKRAGFAVAQAALFGVVISSAYKALTGRVEPPLGAALVDNSRDFNFGFLEYGVFWGWPSGHTTTAFAIVVALILVLPRHRITTGLLLAYGLYIGLSVSISIHWLSDFTAGAIIGSLIGSVTGVMWRDQEPAARTAAAPVPGTPATSPPSPAT